MFDQTRGYVMFREKLMGTLLGKHFFCGVTCSEVPFALRAQRLTTKSMETFKYINKLFYIALLKRHPSVVGTDGPIGILKGHQFLQYMSEECCTLAALTF